MSLLGKVRKNEVVLGFEEYCFLLRGEEKSGKTSFYADLVKEFYKDSSAGLLIPFEKGYSAISDINVFPYTILPKTKIDGKERDGWDIFTELVNELIETKATNGIKLVCIDTVDEFFKVAIEKVKRLSVQETGKPCKSINDAFGGYGRGRERLGIIIKEQTQKLRSAGFGVMYIGHTKYKTLKTKSDETEYQILGSNLSEDYDKMIANDADMILMITQEPEIVDGKIVGNERKLRLRSDGFYSAGSRFKNVPETIPCSAEEFIKTFMKAVMEASGINSTKIFKDKVKEQHDAMEHEREITTSPMYDKKEIVGKLQAKVKGMSDKDKKDFTAFIAEYKPNFKDPESLSDDLIQILIDKFQLI